MTVRVSLVQISAKPARGKRREGPVSDDAFEDPESMRSLDRVDGFVLFGARNYFLAKESHRKPS